MIVCKVGFSKSTLFLLLPFTCTDIIMVPVSMQFILLQVPF